MVVFFNGRIIFYTLKRSRFQYYYSNRHLHQYCTPMELHRDFTRQLNYYLLYTTLDVSASTLQIRLLSTFRHTHNIRSNVTTPTHEHTSHCSCYIFVGGGGTSPLPNTNFQATHPITNITSTKHCHHLGHILAP